MGKMIKFFTFINCPVVKKSSCRFTIDNNFFPLLIAPHGSITFSDFHKVLFFDWIFTFINSCRFTIDNNFFPLLIGERGSFLHLYVRKRYKVYLF